MSETKVIYGRPKKLPHRRNLLPLNASPDEWEAFKRALERVQNAKKQVENRLQSMGYNTSAIPQTTVAENGAFTGADRDQIGLFVDDEVADTRHLCDLRVGRVVGQFRHMGIVRARTARGPHQRGHDVVVDDGVQLAALRFQRGLDGRSLAAPKPHVSMRTEHVNAVWQIDASVCVLYKTPKGELLLL